ncbi:ATP-binding cassette domain-containing protein [Skermanella pratensis]|uniref:ATP-binding cassette domain-containing protein n=1 Tax=Skermanella pratensis TaxID=2233999 RepID=UPI0013018485|nr:ATP-binding cassette domain-containing protein [Skermanella pratensis]
MSGPLLEARDLHKSFGGGWSRRPAILAVDGVGLAVRPGETLGIVGESGSGKSTLARLLAGLETPTSGTVLIDGAEVGRRRSRELHRKVQFVFQDPGGALNPRKAISSILEAPLIHLLDMPKPDRRKRVAELMDLVNLRPEFLDRYPHEFSGGQAQRIGIARALAADPRLIILDEPVSALDVSIQAQILNLLNRLKKDLGLAYVFISHDLAVVESLCDTVAVMRQGRIVEQAPRRILFGSPRHPYTRTLLASVPKFCTP